MTIHFDTVGFSVAGYDEFGQLVSAAYDRAASVDAVVDHTSGWTATYRDPSGALLTIHSTGHEIVCIQPSFDSDLRIRWRPLTVVPDESCAFCDVVSAEFLASNDEMIYPFAMHIESIGANRALIPFAEPAEARLAGLCESGEVWPDENAFYGAQDARMDKGGRAVRFGSQMFVPSGMFGSGPMTAHALVHGIVVSVEERQNELGGGSFRVARLDTYGGQIDTCWAPGQGDGLVPGAVAKVSLWLIGDPITLRDY